MTDPDTLEKFIRMTPQDQLEMANGCIAMIREILESLGCCHGHDGKNTPPMMYPEWIACTIKHHIDLQRERCAKVAESWGGDCGFPTSYVREKIAAAIRSGEGPR